MTGGVVHLCGRARFIAGAADPKKADLVFLQELIDAGKLRTVIGRRYRLDEIAEAHRYADIDHKIGNVALLIGDRAPVDSQGQLLERSADDVAGATLVGDDQAPRTRRASD